MCDYCNFESVRSLFPRAETFRPTRRGNPGSLIGGCDATDAPPDAREKMKVIFLAYFFYFTYNPPRRDSPASFLFRDLHRFDDLPVPVSIHLKHTNSLFNRSINRISISSI